MIAKEFELFLLEQEETFLTPAENLAVLIDTHNADHAILLLSQMTYTRVPVVTAEKKFVGTIGLRDIFCISNGAGFESGSHGGYGYCSHDKEGCRGS